VAPRAGRDGPVRQGEAADGAYFVVSGRLRVSTLADDGEAERILAEIGPGQPVGELALLTDEPRSATVLAVRDSIVVRVATAVFDSLMRTEPASVLALARRVAQRLVGATRAGARPLVTPVSTVAVVAAGPDVDLGGFVEGLRGALDRRAPTRLVRAADVATDPDTMLANLMDGQDRVGGVTLLQAEDAGSEWAARCLRQADRVLVVANPSGSPDLGPAGRALGDLDRSGVAPRTELVMVQPPWQNEPHGTGRWLRLRPFDDHHHVRAGDEAGCERLARGLLGRSIGLVLGGGGARAAAHIGVYRALVEAGLPVDRVGGASIGGLASAQIAAGWTAERMEEVNNREWNRAQIGRRLTLPLISVLSVRTAMPMFEAMFGERDLEDLWLPCFVATADLTGCRLVAMRHGRISRWVCATASPPGVWPPVVDEHGNLFVDGAVLDNLPVDPMRGQGAGRIIAVNVSRAESMIAAAGIDKAPSPLEYLRRRLRSRDEEPFPTIVKLLWRTSVVTSLARQGDARAHSDLFLEPSVDEFGLTDYRHIPQIVAAGYDCARRALGDHPDLVAAWT